MPFLNSIQSLVRVLFNMSLHPEVTFNILIKILKACGTWPEKISSRAAKINAFVVHFLLIDLVLVLLLTHVLKSNDLKDIAEAMNLLLTFLMSFMKSLNLMWKIKDVLQLIEMIKDLMGTESLINNHSDEKLKLRLSKAKKLMKVYWFTALLAVFFGLTQPFCSRKLKEKMWLSFDAEKNVFIFYPIALYQLVSSLHNCTMCVALDFLPIFFMSYSIGFMEMLYDQLGKLGREKVDGNSLKVENSDGTDDILKELVECMKTQIAIKNILTKIEEIFSSVLMVQGLMSVIIFCTTSFTIAEVSKCLSEI